MPTTATSNDPASGHHRAPMAEDKSYPQRARQWWDDLSVFWKRRIIVMGVAALVVAIPLTILIRNGGGGSESSTPAPAAVKLHPKAVKDVDLGLSVRVPVGWAFSRRQGTVILASQDHTARLVFGAPAVEGQRDAVLSAVLDGIRRHYKGVKIRRDKGTEKLGGIPMANAVVATRTDSGTAIGIHVAAGTGKHHTYLVESTTGANAPALRLAEGQAALNTLRLTK